MFSMDKSDQALISIAKSNKSVLWSD